MLLVEKLLQRHQLMFREQIHRFQYLEVKRELNLNEQPLIVVEIQL